MGVTRFRNSLCRILRNPDVNRPLALCRHLAWQLRKLVRAFPVELRLSHSRLVFPNAVSGVAALINSQGMYDYNNMNLIRLLLEHGGTFIDVGANLGSYTLIASEVPKGSVVAVEAHPRTFELLRQNVALNKRANVRVLNVALGARNGICALTDTPMSSTTHIGSGGEVGTISVPMMRADSLLECEGAPPDYVKIDVEGFELDVIEGFGDALDRVRVIFVEMNELGGLRGRDTTELIERVRSRGFAGPFAYHHRSRSLNNLAGDHTEDAVFINRRWTIYLIETLGIEIPSNLH